ncbi:sugar O-acetyltransferase [Draconibacterium sp. IB214405]|uniref:sugar O-acetyltransferase n=1 Tax=Draconibacterium sp. IB214405 TaxID=3097352 RepID=UPI002A1818E9|nr:sugar O-acetyltransferase [Draconibacterium sp. IB214405]MDX8339423.1 sugar O-acetyltransferase [Draconibacterium sp. IB214405]
MSKDIFQRLQSGEAVSYTDPQHFQISEAAARTTKLLIELNATAETEKVRQLWGEISGEPLDASTMIQIPVHVNIGKFTRIGKNVYINHLCSMLDMGTITIGDNVLIGPKVNILSEEHPVNPADRKALMVRPVVIKNGAWIGAAATILPGVTVGENSIVAAGAVVNKDVPDNTIVGGIPAKVIKQID